MSTRREAIVKAAADIFARKGFLGTTVREISDEAGILSGSLYHHFDSKEALALEVLQGYYENMLRSFQEVAASDLDPSKMVLELIRASCRGIEESPGAVGLILNSGEHLLSLPRFSQLADMNSEMRRIWIGVLQAGKAKSGWIADLDPVLVYLSIRDVLAGAVTWWNTSGRYSIDELADRYSEMLLFGIGSK